jgi:hypothetical protein
MRVPGTLSADRRITMNRTPNRIARHDATRRLLAAATALGAALPPAAAAPCDLRAELVAPAAADLRALAPEASVDLVFIETGTPTSGSHVYRPVRASPHDDSDNGNHHPARTVTFTTSVTLKSRPDLTIAPLPPPAPGIRVGNCNALRVRVGNAGGSLAGLNQLRVLVYRPGQPGDVADRHTVQLGDLPAGQSRDVEVRPIQVPLPGPWRFEVIADAANTIDESNESNNRAAIDANVTQLCPP